MNSIETLPISIERNGSIYTLDVYVTAWSKLCVAYRNIMRPADKYCSVVVERDKEPAKPTNIENESIGNARNLDDAVEMMRSYIENGTTFEEQAKKRLLFQDLCARLPYEVR